MALCFLPLSIYAAAHSLSLSLWVDVVASAVYSFTVALSIAAYAHRQTRITCLGVTARVDVWINRLMSGFLLLLVVGAWVQAVERFQHPIPLNPHLFSVGLMAAYAVINALMYGYVNRDAKRLGSLIHHAQARVFLVKLMINVLIGFGLWMGMYRPDWSGSLHADTVITVVLSLYILWEARHLYHRGPSQE